MVMMHEVAHCKQMNHSKLFWQVRNRYADQMKELWDRQYRGEGIWGRGQDLTTGGFLPDRMPAENDVPEHLCGGTYRRGRGRKRKRGQDGDKPKVSYAERQQKRIAKKFGVHGDGQGLGEDELVRGALEQGKRHQGKPKVAGSKRGRELRANAALARFEAAKTQQRDETPEIDGSETEWDDDEWGNGLPILEKLGESIKDGEGRDMFRVCGDGGDDAEGGMDEMAEMRRQMGSQKSAKRKAKPAKRLHEDSETESGGSADEVPVKTNGGRKTEGSRKTITIDDSETESDDETQLAEERTKSPPARSSANERKKSTRLPVPDDGWTRSTTPSDVGTGVSAAPPEDASTTAVVACPVCSLENDADSPTCLACANVLKPKLVPNTWRCKSDGCNGNQYLNAGDAGRCGLCGTLKPPSAAGMSLNGARPLGLTAGEALRWD